MSQDNQRQRTAFNYDFLPPDPMPKTAPSAHFRRNLDIVDAEFERVIEQTPVKPWLNDNQPSTEPRHKTSVSQAISTAAWLIRHIEHVLLDLSGRVFAGLIIASVIAMFWAAGSFVGLSSDVTLQKPDLDFGNVVSGIENANGVELLVVTGAVENNAAKARHVPPVRIGVNTEGVDPQI